MRKIYFRADAGAEIGYGHFVRTLALADMLKDNFECVFVTQNPTEYQKTEMAKVCPWVAVPATEEKFPAFLEMLNGDEIVVLDNYFYDTAYQRTIKNKGCRLVCIDDMHDKHYVADVVINHALTRKEQFSGEFYTTYCLGLEWALLRKPFLDDVSVNHFDRGNNIVISVGGADPCNLNGKIIEAVANQVDYEKLFVISGVATRLGHISAHDVEIYRNLSATEIVELFSHAKFGIFSASTICIEALATGLPVYVGYYVNNQEEFYHALVARHYACGLDDLQGSGLILRNLEPCIKGFDRRIMLGIRERYINLFNCI